MSFPPRQAAIDTPAYEVCRRSPLTLFENHYEEREREPHRTNWGDGSGPPHNTLRTYAGGGFAFEGVGEGTPRGYEVDLDQCETNDQAWEWVRHVSTKTWASTNLLLSLEDALFDLGYITGLPSWSRLGLTRFGGRYEPEETRPERKGRSPDEDGH